ncbi:MAG: hypothetical protein ACI89J_002621, partial [Hyphomicrobiaceae bacterium]
MPRLIGYLNRLKVGRFKAHSESVETRHAVELGRVVPIRHVCLL